MSAEKNWQFELEEYIKQGEPGQIEKSEACGYNGGIETTSLSTRYSRTRILLLVSAYRQAPVTWKKINK